MAVSQKQNPRLQKNMVSGGKSQDCGFYILYSDIRKIAGCA